MPDSLAGGDHTGPPSEIATDHGVLRFWKWWCPKWGDLTYTPGPPSCVAHRAVYTLDASPMTEPAAPA